MTRKEELLSVFEEVEGKNIILKLIDDMIYLEQQLEQLKKLPMIKVNPNNPELQKTTPAAKLYKEFLKTKLSKLENEEKNNCKSTSVMIMGIGFAVLMIMV